MKATKATDPAIISEFNKTYTAKKVTDPEILRQFENSNNEESQEFNDNEESFLKKLPRNLLIGAAHGGRNLHNAPHDIVEQLENALKGMGNNFKNLPGTEYNSSNQHHLSGKFPYDPTDYSKIFGQKDEPTLSDMTIQKVTEHLPDILTLSQIYRNIPIALTRKGASRELRQAQNLARERNISNLNIPDEILQDAAHFLPTTRPYQTLLKEAGQGNYDPLFALQSELGHASRGFSKNPFSFAERRHGREAGKLRERLINAIESELQQQNHLDIADLLRQGQRRYRNYNRLKPARNIAIGAAATQIPYVKKILKHLDVL